MTRFSDEMLHAESTTGSGRVHFDAMTPRLAAALRWCAERVRGRQREAATERGRVSDGVLPPTPPRW